MELSKIQKEIIIGTLLGDSSLQTFNKDRKTYRLRFFQKLDQKEYIDHLYEIWKDWVLTPPKISSYQDKRTNKIYSRIYFNTITHSEFKKFGDLFYKQDPENRKFVKIVPSEEILMNTLTARGLAYWFMDDGSRVSKNVKSMRICTDSFKYEEVLTLIKILNIKFNLKCSIIKDGSNNRIYISSYSYYDFIKLINPYIIPSMEYKIYF